MSKTLILIPILASGLMLTACGTTTSERVATGALGGVAAGALIGGSATGAVVGGVAGAAVGAAVDADAKDHERDRREGY